LFFVVFNLLECLSFVVSDAVGYGKTHASAADCNIPLHLHV